MTQVINGQLPAIGGSVARVFGQAYCSVEVVCPATAEGGELVQAGVIVTNLDPFYNWIFKTELLADSELIAQGDELIPAGQSRTYYGNFIMPGHNVTILGWVNRVSSLEPYQEVFAGADSATISYVPPAPPVPPPCSISVSAPDSAREGETVEVAATIRNNSAYAELYKIEIYAGADLLGSITDTIPGNSSRSYGDSFAMPAYDVVILVWVEVSYLGEWRYSSSASRTVTLAPEVTAWIALAQVTISITVPEVVAWVTMAEEELAIAVSEVVGWVALAEEQITISLTAVVAWVTMAEEEISIAAGPKYEVVQHTIYPFSYTYEGDAETCTFEFRLSPEQIPATEWLGERIVNSFVNELETEGAKLLELKVSRDITPPLWTNYRVEVTATASPLAWNLIIIGVLAILFIVAIYFTIKLVDKLFFHRRPGLHEVKPGWGKDTLVSAIQDSEEEWERTLTPIETLEGMSEAELRDLLDKIAEEEVAPEVPGIGLGLAMAGVALAAVGLVGVGAVALMGRGAGPKE